MPYKIILADPVSGENAVLCYAMTREEAQQIITDLRQEHADLRLAAVADEDEE